MGKFSDIDIAQNHVQFADAMAQGAEDAVITELVTNYEVGADEWSQQARDDMRMLNDAKENAIALPSGRLEQVHTWEETGGLFVCSHCGEVNTDSLDDHIARQVEWASKTVW